MKTITHFLFGFGILFTSFSVICLGNSPILAIVLLIATFVLAAIYLILLGISFIGITYIILYVGAIAVLFLFVIMMLNLKDKDLIEPSSVSLNNGVYSFIVVIFFAYLINSLTLFSLNFKNLIALDYLGLKDWYYLKITAIDQTNNINVNYSTGSTSTENLLLYFTEFVEYLNNEFELAQDKVLDTSISEPHWSGKFLWELSDKINKEQISDYVILLDKVEPLQEEISFNTSTLDFFLDDTLPSQEEISANTSHADITLLDLTQIETLGQDLYTYGAVLLISLSIILLLAMFATIIISKPNVKLP